MVVLFFRANVALLYSNTGRLMRVCTQTLFGDCNDHATFDPQEKVYYTKAIEYYQQSLRVLRERHLYPEIWDRVSWELSGTFYTMGTLVQDFTLSRNVEPEQVSLASGATAFGVKFWVLKQIAMHVMSHYLL